MSILNALKSLAGNNDNRIEEDFDDVPKKYLELIDELTKKYTGPIGEKENNSKSLNNYKHKTTTKEPTKSSEKKLKPEKSMEISD